ncbi:unnamed protein product [Adineta steineri]|uniref:Uncharacterized protein n=1 Tax=Adineta steineri TaxID=433720 RepID=A0A814B3V7_9BILA|nr:unnamed protein product [Adineta steineri]
MTWASIERHILVFSSHRHRFDAHTIPLIFCLIYPILFYTYTIFFYPCEQIFEYQQVLCGSPCFKRTSFILMHIVVPCILVSVIQYKRRI